MKSEHLLIHEIYKSIQGESSFAGLPCTFVRTTGCNLRCSWCDTEQAFYGGTKVARATVLEEALAHGTQLVEVTGGEPLLQAGVLPDVGIRQDGNATVSVTAEGITLSELPGKSVVLYRGANDAKRQILACGVIKKD